MKSKLFLLLSGLLLTGHILAAYDLQTKALTPVKLEKAPSHAPVKMVENGKLNFVIAADLQAERRMQSTNRTQKSIGPALEILKEVFTKCTGSTPVVCDISKIPEGSFLIVVGDNALTRANGIDVTKLPLQGFTVRTFDKGIILAGNDSSLVKGYNSKKMEGRGSSTGTKYAAYDFAERFLGVRYYFPGEYGSVYPKLQSFTLTPASYSDAPYFDGRNGIFYLGHCTIGNPNARKFWESYLGKLEKNDEYFWDRWRMGGTIPGGGSHCPRPEFMAKNYPDKLKTIFYTSPSGNFWYNPKAHVGNYFDVVNLEFADLLIETYKEYFKSEGKVDKGGFGTSGCNLSSVSFGMCDTLMPDTDVINHPVVRKYGLMTQKDIQRGPNAGMANIYARFHQYLAKRVNEEFPGRKLWIMAYYNVKYAGTDPRWTLPPNTEVNLCLGDLPSRIPSKSIMKENVEISREWYESLGKRPVQKLWLYTGDNPFVVAVEGEYVAKIPKIFGKYLGTNSLFLDHCGAKTWFHYYSFYTAYRSMWNPELDTAAAIDEHWELFYGKKAAEPLRKFYALLKSCYERYGAGLRPGEALVYPMQDLTRMEGYLAEAKKAVTPGSVEEKRMKLFAGPWDKAISSMKNQISYERPVYPVYQLLRKEKVTLDGVASEEFWKKVKEMKLMDPKGSSEPLKFPVSLKLAWDKSGIYGLFITSYPALADKKKDLWANDSYEVFLSPGMKKADEFQFAFDALGGQFLGTQHHLPIPQPFDSFWKAPGFKHVSKLDSGKWTVEFYIPFSVFKGYSAPKSYETWFANVVRNKMSLPREYSGSSMTLGNNHNMDMYGMIKFAGKGE